MAMYKYSTYLAQVQDGVFDGDHTPGEPTPRAGVYRCMACGREVVSEEGKPLPPQNHHQHEAMQGRILWRLIVFADHRPK